MRSGGRRGHKGGGEIRRREVGGGEVREAPPRGWGPGAGEGGAGGRRPQEREVYPGHSPHRLLLKPSHTQFVAPPTTPPLGRNAKASAARRTEGSRLPRPT